MWRIKSRRDLGGGILIVACGIGAVLEGKRHAIGTFMQMQAGFFPVVLGILLTAIGLAIVAGAFLSGTAAQDELGHEMTLPDWRGCIAIVTGVVAFILLGYRFGLAPATFACAFISALGDRDATLRAALLLACALTVLAAGLFWYLLQIPFPLVRW